MMKLLKRLSTLIFFSGILAACIMISVLDVLSVKAIDEKTVISIEPESQFVDLMQPFYVDVLVTDVTDLTAWQVWMHYDPTVLSLINITLPTGHVFEDKYPQFIIAENYIENKLLVNETVFDFSDPIDTMWYGEQEEPEVPKVKSYMIEGWWDEDGSQNLSVLDLLALKPKNPSVLHEIYTVTSITQVWDKIVMKLEIAHAICGALIFHEWGPFNGSGKLFRLEFVGLSPGNSTLKFFRVPEYTYLLDSSINVIAINAINSSITIIGPEKISSDITLDSNVTSVELGTNISLVGAIIPARNDTDVYIWSQYDGITRLLDTCKTDSEGYFATMWNTSVNPGKYMLKATWLGDWQTLRADSLPVNTTVTGVFYVFDLKLGGKWHSVVISCNLTLTNFTHNQSLPGLTFEVNGNLNTTGYCHVVIPKTLLTGNPWLVTIDSENVDFEYSEHATLNVLYFTFNHEDSSQQVIIHATWIIPEFPLILILPLFMIATLLAVVIYMKIAKSDRSH